MKYGEKRNEIQVLRLLLLVVVVCVGCGPNVELATCQGIVQYEGKPLTSGMILFSPYQKGHRGFSTIQADGRYDLETMDVGGGAPPGEYRVSVNTTIDMNGKQTKIGCSCPRDLIATIKPGMENEINFNIQESEGWEVTPEDE